MCDIPKTRYVAEFIGKTNFLTLGPETDGQVQIKELGITVPIKEIWREGPISHTISIRPEKIRRTAGHESPGMSFRARVKDVLFLGDIVHYTAALQSGKTLLFQEHRGPGVSVLGQDQVIDLAFQPSDALPVADGESQS